MSGADWHFHLEVMTYARLSREETSSLEFFLSTVAYLPAARCSDGGRSSIKFSNATLKSVSNVWGPLHLFSIFGGESRFCCVYGK